MATGIVRREEFGKDWLEIILAKEHQCHHDFFGQEFDLTSFEAILRKYGLRAINQWRELGLEPHFLPSVVMAQDANFPGWKVKPSNWYYEKVAAGKVLRRQPDGQLAVDPGAFNLEGITVLVDTRLKPAYKDGRQMFRKDNLLGPIIKKLRQDGKVARYKYGHQSSRFGVSAEEWEIQIKPALAEFLAVEVSQVRLERAIEANVISQLYPHLPRQKDGKTNTWVRYEEYLLGNDFYRLAGGCSVWGGLASVGCDWADSHWENRAFRPLVVFLGY